MQVTVLDRGARGVDLPVFARSGGQYYEASAALSSTLCYAPQLVPETSGSLAYGVRVVPYHKGLPHPLELGLARWA